MTQIAHSFTILLFALVVFSACTQLSSSTKEISEMETKTSLDIIAYYSGSKEDISDFAIEQLDQIIFSFLHLKGNQLAIDNAEDSLTLLTITELKKTNPQLKVLVSLGGWGGCETCSSVFSTQDNRQAFAESVLNILKNYHADGIDLDWEYPAIEGFPDHKYKPEDKQNFTALVQSLRAVLGNQYQVSFAAGGTEHFMDNAVEWKKVMPLIDQVNIMTYDLISGYSTETGHHTALYSNPKQLVSTEYAVDYLSKLGVPADKIVIGAAFYARVWEEVVDVNHGLYQSGKFLKSIGYVNMKEVLLPENGFEIYWDSTTMAPYAYHKELQQFMTYDDASSIEAKVAYAKKKRLGGIMFWELNNDKKKNGLLNTLYQAARTTQ